MATASLIIPAGVDVSADHADLDAHIRADKAALRQRWYSDEGKRILAAWRNSGYDRERLDSLVGRFYGKPDLRGVPLAGANLERADLRGIELYGADLSGANLTAAKLDDSHLSEADLRGTRLAWASMKDTFVDNVEFDTNTDFLGVPLYQINFNLAALLQEHARTQQRIAHLQRRHPWLAKWLWLTCDYGRSLRRWLVWVAGVIVLFGAAYSVMQGQLKEADTFFDCLYFSFVTFSTLGYGDISPITKLAKAVVILEVSIGYMMGGLLVAILAKRLLGD